MITQVVKILDRVIVIECGIMQVKNCGPKMNLIMLRKVHRKQHAASNFITHNRNSVRNYRKEYR